MRINAATNVRAQAWPGFAPARVKIRIGSVHVTASPAEARALAVELVAAADAAEAGR